MIDKELVKHVIKRFTDDKVDDPIADKDTLVSLVAIIVFGDSTKWADAERFIITARKEKIREDKESARWEQIREEDEF